jgi:hypothetical protein
MIEHHEHLQVWCRIFFVFYFETDSLPPSFSSQGVFNFFSHFSTFLFYAPNMLQS